MDATPPLPAADVQVQLQASDDVMMSPAPATLARDAAFHFTSHQDGTTVYSVAGDDHVVLACVADGWAAAVLGRSQRLVVLRLRASTPAAAAGGRKRGRAAWRLSQAATAPLGVCQLSCLQFSTAQCAGGAAGSGDARAAWLLAGSYDGGVLLHRVVDGADGPRLVLEAALSAAQLTPPLQRSPSAGGSSSSVGGSPGLLARVLAAAPPTAVPESLLVLTPLPAKDGGDASRAHACPSPSHACEPSSGSGTSGNGGGSAAASGRAGAGSGSEGGGGSASNAGELLFLVGFRDGGLSLLSWSPLVCRLQTLSHIRTGALPVALVALPPPGSGSGAGGDDVPGGSRGERAFAPVLAVGESVMKVSVRCCFALQSALAPRAPAMLQSSGSLLDAVSSSP